MPAETDSLESLLAQARAEIAAAGSLPALARGARALPGPQGLGRRALRGIGALAEPERLRRAGSPTRPRSAIEAGRGRAPRRRSRAQARDRALASSGST